jgi:outer membrane lipoprotein SlyB
MTRKPGRAFLPASFGLALCAWLAGCAGPSGPSNPEGQASALQGEISWAQGARGAIVIGRSAKSDVVAALGLATVVRFDSGFEVWIYQKNRSQHATRTQAELVVLFSPSGLAQKARIRPAYPALAE